MKKVAKKPGFTLVEVLLAAFLSVILAGLTATGYSSIQQQISQGEEELVLAQNGRAVIDRISRDVRQAVRFATTLPADRAEALTAIEFEDGHDVDENGPIYIEYSFESTEENGFTVGSVRRSRHYYYLTTNPERRLPFDSGILGENNFAKQNIESDSYIVAENVTGLRFWGTPDLLYVDVDLQAKAGGYALPLHSAVARRN